MQSFTRRLRAADQQPRFEAATQRTLEAKLGQPLKRVTLTLRLHTITQRVQTLQNRIFSSLTHVSQPGGNRLALKDSSTHPLILTPGETAALWHLPSRESQIAEIQWTTDRAVPLPVSFLQNQNGVRLGNYTFRGQTHPIRLHDSDRASHVGLMGKTRMGKSTLMHHLAHQDIAAGHGVAVIDPHGDLVESLLRTSIPSSRERDVIVLDIADTTQTFPLNLLAPHPGLAIESVTGQALGVVKKFFAEQWNPTRMEDALYATMSALITYENATLLDISKMLLDGQYRGRVLSKVTDPVVRNYWLHEYTPMTVAHQREVARPIITRVRRFYRDPTVRRLVCHPHSLNFEAMMDNQQILLVNLRGLAGSRAEALGALILSKIQMAAMARAGRGRAVRNRFYLYIDEVQNFITTSLPVMLSEAGKYGLSLVLANQFLNQLAGDTLDAVLGNIDTTIMFRLGPNDASLYQPFVRPHFQTHHLTNMARFTATVSTQFRGESVPAFMLYTLPPPHTLPGANERVQRIKQFSRERFEQYREPQPQAQNTIGQTAGQQPNNSNPPPGNTPDDF